MSRKFAAAMSNREGMDKTVLRALEVKTMDEDPALKKISRRHCLRLNGTCLLN